MSNEWDNQEEALRYLYLKMRAACHTWNIVFQKHKSEYKNTGDIFVSFTVNLNWLEEANVELLNCHVLEDFRYYQKNYPETLKAWEQMIKAKRVFEFYGGK